jgi:hypothetical protein
MFALTNAAKPADERPSGAVAMAIVRRLDSQAAILGHRVASIDAQIKQRVLKLVGINERVHRPAAPTTSM